LSTEGEIIGRRTYFAQDLPWYKLKVTLVNLPLTKLTRRGSIRSQAEQNSLSKFPRLNAAETFNFHNASFSLHEFMRRDAYSGDECGDYCLISQTTVYDGEVESDEVPARHKPLTCSPLRMAFHEV